MARGTIQIVEADGVHSNRLRDMLTAMGYIAYAPVSTGREAVAAAAERHPGLVLMDSELPGDMDGVAAAERIRSLLDIPVIFLGADAQTPPVHEDGAAAPGHSLVKPVSERELAIAIDAAFERAALERKLRESERRYAELTESMPYGFALHEIILDSEGKPRDYRFLEANPAFERLTGLPVAGIAGRIMSELIPETEPFWFETYGRVALTGEPARFESYVGKLGRHYEVTAYSSSPGRFVTVFHDITERKRTEEALKRRESILAQAGRMAGFGAWDIEYSDYRNRDKNPLRWSDEAYRIFGYEPGSVEVTNALFFERVHPDDRDMIMNTVARAMEQQTPYEIEHRIIRPDGTERVVREHAEITFDERGTPLRMVGAVQDITDRKLAEKALRENRAELARAQAVAKTGSWWQDLRINELRWSAETYRIFGVPEGTRLDGESFFERVHPEDRDRVRRAWAAALNGEPYDIEHRIIADGGVKWVRELAELDFDTGHVPLGGFGIVQDITERKRAEAALRTSEERLRLAMEASSDGLWDWNLQTDEVYWSPRAYTMLGYVPDEFPVDYSVWESLIHPEDRERASASVLEQIRAGGGSFRVEFRMRNRQDGWQWIIGRGKAVEWGPEGTATRMIGTHVDITELKQAGEALRERERRYRELFEKTPVGVFQTTSGGRAVTINPAMAAILGFASPEETVARYSDLARQLWVQASQRDEFIRLLRENGSVEGFEYEARRADGRHIWISMNARISGMREDGSFTIDGFSVDITEQKMAETALRESEMRWRSYVENAPYGVFLADERGCYLQVNPAACRMTGYTESELLARGIPDLLPPEHREAGMDSFARLMRDGHSETETVFLTAGGERRWWSVAAVRLSPDRFLSFASDTTDRRRTEEEVKRNEAFLRRIFDILPVGLWFTDKTGTLLSGNPAGVRIWGAEPHVAPSEYGVFRARRLPSGRGIAPDDWALAHTIREGITVQEELLEIEAFDGVKRVILNSTAPVYDDAGEIQGAIVVNQDITDFRLLEQQLLQSQKMETIGRLAGGIAHDFNNILTVINTNAEMVLMFMEPDAEIRESVEDIRKAGERAATLTRQLLAFSRKQVVEPKVASINRILLDMDRMLRRLIGENIELVIIPDESLRPVRVDVGQIEQVLTNLVVNARDAMPEGGALTIETRNITLDGEYVKHHPEIIPGEYVMFSVADTGIGMDADTLSHIFEPFFTTKPQGSGTGLGLSTCYGIIRQSGGGIEVNSEPGKGTTVIVSLPASDEAVVISDSGGVPAPPAGSETILLAEDDPSIRRLVARLLQQAGYHVHSASNGSEALAVLRAYGEPVHLLITDMVMPLMGGRELAEAVRGINPAARVLFMSGYTDNAIVQHGILNPGVMFIQKPFSPSEFLRKVREALENSGMNRG